MFADILIGFFVFLLAIYFIVCVLLYFLQEKLLFHPEKLPSDYRFNFKSDFEEYFFETEKDVKINALWFKKSNSKGVIFYFHGNAGSLRKWGEAAEELVLLTGYDVLIFDYRGYGKSSRNFSEKGFYKDAQFIYDQIRKQRPESEIVVFGRSLGTGMASKIAAENQPKMLFLETPYYSLRQAAQLLVPYLPSILLRYRFPSFLYIPKVQCPIYAFHGTSDSVIHYQSAQKLSKLFKEKDRLFTYEGGEHNNLMSFVEYRMQLKNLTK